MDDEEHLRLTGFSNRQILENLKNLSRKGCDIVIRVPLIPGLNDGEDALRRVGIFAAELPRAHPVDILPYERVGIEKYARMNLAYRLPDVMTPDAAAAANAARILEDFGLDVTVGGDAP
jgi:pyruvate formate lyase activating enzyme